MRAAKACAHPTCPQLQPCPTHQREPWQGRKGRHGRMRSGSREQKINAAVMLRDNGLCQIPSCNALAEQVDHVIPLEPAARLPQHQHLPADDSMANRQAICRDCHNRKTQQEAARARHAP